MDWETIEARLLSLLNENRHGQLRGALMMLNPVDIASFMKQLDPEKLLLLFRILPKDVSADVFSYMDADQRETLVNSIGDAEITALIDGMFVDDAVDFLEELPANAVKRVLQNTDPKTRGIINQFLKYPENSAGSLMTIEYCEFPPRTNVAEALKIIKDTGVDKETVYTLYLVDDKRRLVGTVPLHKALVVDEDTLLIHLVDPSLISVNTLDDQEHVADTVRSTTCCPSPWWTARGGWWGIITADDIMDVTKKRTPRTLRRCPVWRPPASPISRPVSSPWPATACPG